MTAKKVDRRKGSRRSSGNVAEGVLHVNPRGFGFVEVEDRDDDLFCHERNMGTALDGDRVRVGLAAATRGEKNQECEVLDVLERRRTQTVGTFSTKGHFALVEPDDKRLTHDIYVPGKSTKDAKDGYKVIVSIDRFEDSKASPEGRVLRVLGPSDDPEVRVLSVAMSHDVRVDFPDAVLKEAESASQPLNDRATKGRLDLRDKNVFTIDPKDAKDFDDAIHIEQLENGHFEVGVHIADVSHYVRPGSALDDEAYERATSVYLVDRVIPMLPETLSNGACSLRPQEDKLAFSCIMEVTPQGDVAGHELRETVIRSQRRYAYEEAQQRIQGGFPDDPLAEDIVAAARLSRTLTRKRMREGSVDFDLPEIRVSLNEMGHPIELYRKERTEANRLIEELMLLANRTVAGRMAGPSGNSRGNGQAGGGSGGRTFVYRVHEHPDAERIQQLAAYVRTFGYDLSLDDGNVRSFNLNQLLDQAKGKPEEPVIERAALRAMAKAVYSTENVGHYGLGFPHYTHFTSPIRRYPDLMIHRLLKAHTDGARGGGMKTDDLQARCEHCSERERAAVDAERDSLKLKQVEFIRQHIGDQFDGVVSSATKFGLFIELEDVLVEGLVHVRDMDDYFFYDEDRFMLVGKDSGRSYKPGDEVRVKVVGANLEKREVDLMFADA